MNRLKRLQAVLFIFMAIFLFPGIVQPAVTLRSNDVTPLGFSVNANSSDFSACEELVAGVSGESIYIERIAISSAAAINITLGAGETTGAVTTVILGPLYLAANTGLEFVFTRPIKLAAATALVADASGAGAATIIVQGFAR